MTHGMSWLVRLPLGAFAIGALAFGCGGGSNPTGSGAAGSSGSGDGGGGSSSSSSSGMGGVGGVGGMGGMGGVGGVGGMGGMGGVGGMGGMGGVGGMGGAGGGPSPDITGTIIKTWLTEGGELNIPADPAKQVLAALVLQADGTFAPPIVGTISADGSFTIPNVPQGVNYIEFGSASNTYRTYTVTTERVLDLGSVASGRPDRVRIMINPTNLIFNVDGLDPWQDADRFELWSLGSWTIASPYYFGWNGTPVPTAGDTSLAGMITNAAQINSPNLVDGSKGDQMYLNQLVAHQAGGSAYDTIQTTFKPAPFTMTDGQPTTLSGNFEQVPQKQVQVTWERSAFENMVQQVHPGATLFDLPFFIQAEPGGPNRFTGQNPTLMRLTNSDNTPTVSLSASYGNPFPAGWGVIQSSTAYIRRYFTLPNDPMMRFQPASISMAQPVDPNGNVTVAPGMSPPQGLTVNGMDATVDLTGVGTSPTISWMPPQMGVPTRYNGGISVVNPNSPVPQPVLAFNTDQTTFVVPPGFMQPGSYYTVSVTAQMGAGTTVKAPYKSDFGPRASAVSSTMTP